MMSDNSYKIERIRILNDDLRSRQAGGQVYITAGVRRGGAEFEAAVLKAVRNQSHFPAGDDAERTHEMGGVKVGSSTILWKIDCFEKGNHPYLSPDPADASITDRVLTIATSMEY